VPEVLFVSKPVVAPFNDGSKCLVRDIAGALTAFEPRVMVTKDANSWSNDVLVARVYAGTGGYRPALVENARVLAWLLLHSKSELWHFLFAPNPRTSQIGKLVKQIRRIPVVQTIASPPRTFEEPQRLLFGDVVVAQSEWTKNEFLRAYERAQLRDIPRIEVIAPSVPEFARPSTQRMQAIRAQLDLGGDSPILLYPGDLEVVRARECIVSMIEPLLREAPGACVVFAYRNKTPRAAEIAQALRSVLPANAVRFIAEVPDMHALVATSQLLLFPVDDLYGKVDLPIVILEAMHLGVPVVTADEGPLADLQGGWKVPASDHRALLRVSLRALWDTAARQSCIETEREALQRHYRPAHAACQYEAIYESLRRRE